MALLPMSNAGKQLAERDITVYVAMRKLSQSGMAKRFR